MLNIPELGTAEKTSKSKFQIILVDNSNLEISPMNRPKLNRFFETIEERKIFLTLFERAIEHSGGKLIHKKNLDHMLFKTFAIVDRNGNSTHDLTIYS